ncbi:hypothetical protein WG66_005158, partial [Moniliophthora roreri]
PPVSIEVIRLNILPSDTERAQASALLKEELEELWPVHNKLAYTNSIVFQFVCQKATA